MYSTITKDPTMSGIYNAPDGQRLHSDGKSIGRPESASTTPPLKISPHARLVAMAECDEVAAREANRALYGGRPAGTHVQLAMNAHAAEACRPLVEVCEEQSRVLRAIRYAWDRDVPLPSLDKVSAAIERGEQATAAHRLAHGPPEGSSP